jgi:uncharacterized protein (TIGR00369 family)
MTSPWQEPVRGGHPAASLLSLPGIEQLRMMLDGRAPRPPISHLTGMKIAEVGANSAVFTMPASQWLATPQGPIQIGTLCVLADGPLGCAVQTALPAGTLYTTSELSLRLLAPAYPGGTLTARGSLLQARRRLALSEAYVQDDRGHVLAHCSSLCFLIPTDSSRPQPHANAPAARAQPQANPPSTPPPPEQTPDPFERPAMGEVLPQELWDRMSGLEVLRALIAGELPSPPIHHLTGIRPTAADEGTATFALPAIDWLTAPPPGRLEGGVIALLADSAASTAIQTLLPAGTAYAPVDLKVNFVRPALTDGREVQATGRVVHAGRSIMLADAEVINAEGKLVALARASALLRPGRAASLTDAEPGSITEFAGTAPRKITEERHDVLD